MPADSPRPTSPFPDLSIKIRAFVTGWNNRATPFAWTKTPDQIP